MTSSVPRHPPSRGRCSENHDRANSALVLSRRGWRPIRFRGGADAEWVARGEGIAPYIPGVASQSERMAPFRAATFDVTRQVTSIATRAESSSELRCMRAASRKIPCDIRQHEPARSIAGTEGFERSQTKDPPRFISWRNMVSSTRRDLLLRSASSAMIQSRGKGTDRSEEERFELQGRVEGNSTS